MIRRLVFAALVGLAPAGPATSQELFSCLLVRDAEIAALGAVSVEEKASADLYGLANRIFDANGLAALKEDFRFIDRERMRDPQVRTVAEGNAIAVLVKEIGNPAVGIPYIVYDARFISDLARNDWALLGVLAHEIAHHQLRHTARCRAGTRETELQADEWAGRALRLMGADLDEAQAFWRTSWVADGAVGIHPSRRDRLATVEAGWRSVGPVGIDPDDDPELREKVRVDPHGSGDFRTLGEALAATADYGTVQVMPGTYREGLEISRPVNIVGIGDRSEITLRLDQSRRIRWSAPSGRIENLTLRQAGSGNLAALSVSSGGLDIRNMLIEVADGRGMSVLADNSDLSVFGVRLEVSKGGFGLKNLSTLTISDSYLKGERKAYALEALSGSEITADRVNVEGFAPALSTGRGSSVTFSNGAVRSDFQAAFVSRDGAEMEVADTRLIQGGRGLFSVESGARAVFRGIDGAIGNASRVQGGGVARVLHSSLRRSRDGSSFALVQLEPGGSLYWGSNDVSGWTGSQSDPRLNPFNFGGGELYFVN